MESKIKRKDDYIVKIGEIPVIGNGLGESIYLLRSKITLTLPFYNIYLEEPRTVEHWLQRCAYLSILQQRTFNCPSISIGVLLADPEKVLTLLAGHLLEAKVPILTKPITNSMLKPERLLINNK